MNTVVTSITKAKAIEAFDGNASALARALKIRPQAIYQWDDGPIPEKQALKLRFDILPEYPWDEGESAVREAS
jgi:hypothetical protein